MSSFEIISAPTEDWDLDEDWSALLPPDWDEQAARVAQEAGIGITRDRNIAYLAISEEQVVGVAWTAYDTDTYEFDVAVLPAWQGRGVGRQLLDLVVTPDDGDDRDLDLTQRVVSPIMHQALAARGFVTTDVRQFTDGTSCDISMRPYSSAREAFLPLYAFDAEACHALTLQWMEKNPSANLDDWFALERKPNAFPDEFKNFIHHLTENFASSTPTMVPPDVQSALVGLQSMTGKRTFVEPRFAAPFDKKTQTPDIKPGMRPR